MPDGTSRIEVASGSSDTGVELLNGLSESVFAGVAQSMVDLGWSIFPQETTGDRRMPGKIHGRTINWKADHDLSNKLPTKAFLRDCILNCASLNVATVFGPASGHTFAVDIDVLDAAMADTIVGLAEEILGTTPFMRVGRAPKIALIYRHGPGEQDVVHSTSRFFAKMAEDGSVAKSGDGLEILGASRLLTFHGRHHKTGNYFKWIGGATPLLDGPETATLVTPDQVVTFLEAVDARYRFHRGSTFTAPANTYNWDGTAIPKICLAGGGLPWTEDAEGMVCDGREAYLTRLVHHTALGFKIEMDVAANGTPEQIKAFKEKLSSASIDQFKRTARMEGRWTDRQLSRETWGKVNRLVDKVVRGEYSLQANERSRTAILPALVLPGVPLSDPDLGFLRPHDKRLKGSLKGTVALPDGPIKDLSISRNRSAIARNIQDGLGEAFLGFLSDVYGHPLGYDPEHQRVRVHILKAPPGAGKTSRCIRTIATDHRTYENHKWKDRATGETKDGRAPWVMLLPTYANIDELRTRASVLNLDGSLDDQALRAAAREANLIQEDELDAKLAELRHDALNCGLIPMTYSGKIKAGCKMQQKVKLAMSAGIGTAAFCKATVRKKEPGAKKDDPGVMVEEFCEYYDGCPAIKQRAEIGQAHVVFMPHSFLGLEIPEELQNVRGVIADERVHHLFLHTATFSATSLSIPRKSPRLTAAERATGAEPDDLLADRDLAADIALTAMRGSGTDGVQCPAQALHDFRPPGTPDDAPLPGHALVRSAVKVCSQAIQRDGTLSPTTTFGDIEALCARPTGRDIREELQFWKIIEERMKALLYDDMIRSTIKSMEADLSEWQGQWEPEKRESKERALERVRCIARRAHGGHDYRIQFLTDPAVNGGAQEIVRISWRTLPNWSGVPVLLLDASAAPPIIAKIWKLPESDIVIHDIVEDTGSILNVKIVGVVNKTFSNSSIAASADATDYVRLDAARNLAKVRQAISAVSALFGHGRVVAGTSIVLRELINHGWACPANVDWCHYGAMRGLDGFKHHAAAISIGRMEPPTRSIDGLVAALTYDDEVPEEPFDRKGDGTDAEAFPLRLPLHDQHLRLRSGYVATLKVPRFDGLWGRLVQRQYREEELLQFVGRLRPVYREGPAPVWFALSSIIPEELIVDDLIELDDLVAQGPSLWDAVRRTEGVVEEDAIHSMCPDIFRSTAAVGRAMADAGFMKDGSASENRAAQGFASYRWWDKQGKERVAFVRAGSAAPVDLLRKVLVRKSVGSKPSVSRMGSRTPELIWSPDTGLSALARPREPDTVEKRIGAAALRPVMETADRDKAASILMHTPGSTDSIGDDLLSLPYGALSGAHPITASELYAKVSVDHFWTVRSGGADDRLMPLLLEQPAAEGPGGEEAQGYEHLGGTVTDQDGATNA
jgi:hypothetical protein